MIRGVKLALGLTPLLVVLLWLGALVAADPLVGEGRQGPTVHLVRAAGGELVGELAHPDLRRGPDLAPGEVPPLLRAAALAAEDRRFYLHPGVDPLALVRALVQDLAAGRVVSGGSTITMQLARLMRPAPRTLGNKLREMALALALEARYGKDEILRRYLNLAPFGGTLVGVSAASRWLLGKDPQRLAPAEAALLMALPQAPSLLGRASHRRRLRRRRDRILREMGRAGDISPGALERALATPPSWRPPPRRGLAPHFLRALAARLGGKAPAEVGTYLDAGLQEEVGRLVARVCRRLRGRGLRQAAVLVLDNRSLGVMAWVGSLDFGDPAGGQVDGVSARRQPGSALKPFIYALALESGATLADQLADRPFAMLVSGGVFRPLDYDRRFRGMVSLRLALGSSLNLPALRLTGRLGPAGVLAHLRALGLGLERPAGYYGLGVALGDGEVSLLELTTAYAALANGGNYRPARLWRGEPRRPGRRVLDPYACRLITDVLADDRARVLGFGRHSLLELPFPAAVKTGTSQYHRDNWCLGYTAGYTVGVWVGNFEGQPMSGLSGVSGAAPLWRAVMLAVQRRLPSELPPWPPGMRRQVVRRAAAEGCGVTAEEIFAPLPPPGSGLSGRRLELLVPFNGGIYARDPDIPADRQHLACRVQLPPAWRGRPRARVMWRLDGRLLAETPSGRGPELPLIPGRHVLEVTARAGGRRLRARAQFTVLP